MVLSGATYIMVEKLNFALCRDFIQKMAVFKTNLKKKLKIIQIFPIFKFLYYNKNVFVDKMFISLALQLIFSKKMINSFKCMYTNVWKIQPKEIAYIKMKKRHMKMTQY